MFNKKMLFGMGIFLILLCSCSLAILYNDSNFTNANNPLEMAQAINQESTGLFGILLLAAIMFMILVVFKRSETDIRDIMVADGFISTIIGILLWGAQLLEWYIVVFPLIVLISGLLAYKFQNTL